MSKTAQAKLDLAQKGYINFLLILILVIGLVTLLYLIKKPTNILPKAYETKRLAPVNDVENVTIMSNERFGMVIDIRDGLRTPNANQFTSLQPGWVRFVYQPQYKIPRFPQGVKTLVVFNQESVPGKPKEKDLLQWKENQGTEIYKEEALSQWRSYTDKYIAGLEDFIKEYALRVDAIEVWNEEDLCEFDYKTIDPQTGEPINKEYFCPKIPEPIYVDMLKRSADVIKEYSPDTKVVMGGLAKGDIFWVDGGYLKRIQKIDPTVFDNVDGVGLHPYGVSFNNWCTPDYIDPKTNQKCQKIISYGNLSDNVQRYKATLPPHVKLWITEIGTGSGDTRLDEWQKEYMENVFDYLQTQAEVVIWYGWSDYITGAGGEVNMGLYDGHGNIKPSGELFRTYSSSTSLLPE